MAENSGRESVQVQQAHLVAKQAVVSMQMPYYPQGAVIHMPQTNALKIARQTASQVEERTRQVHEEIRRVRESHQSLDLVPEKQVSQKKVVDSSLITRQISQFSGSQFEMRLVPGEDDESLPMQTP
jgi:hypothetical protein